MAMSKRTKVLMGGGAAALLVGLVVISAGARRDRGQEVRFEKVGRRDLVAVVTASGKIQPKKKVDISADITGRITKIAVREGDFVRPGQLPNLVPEEQLEQAQTAFDIAEANLTAARHQVDQGRAAVQSARDNLRKTTLIAPMAGRVTRLPVEVGEVAVPSTFSKDIGLLMTISDLSVIQAKVKVDETDVVRVHLGDSVEVAIDAFPDATFTGHVTKVSDSSVLGVAQTTTGQNDRAVDYEVEVTLDKPPSDIRPDLSATARIVTATRKEVLSIPIIALTVREHKPISTEQRPLDTTTTRKKKEAEGVFLVKAGVATFRAVKVGIAGDEYFEVVDALKEGDTIVAGPYQAIRDLKDGARVRAMKASADSTKKKPAA